MRKADIVLSSVQNTGKKLTKPKLCTQTQYFAAKRYGRPLSVSLIPRAGSARASVTLWRGIPRQYNLRLRKLSACQLRRRPDGYPAPAQQISCGGHGSANGWFGRNDAAAGREHQGKSGALPVRPQCAARHRFGIGKPDRNGRSGTDQRHDGEQHHKAPQGPSKMGHCDQLLFIRTQDRVTSPVSL